MHRAIMCLLVIVLAGCGGPAPAAQQTIPETPAPQIQATISGLADRDQIHQQTTATSVQRAAETRTAMAPTPVPPTFTASPLPMTPTSMLATPTTALATTAAISTTVSSVLQPAGSPLATPATASTAGPLAPITAPTPEAVPAGSPASTGGLALVVHQALLLTANEQPRLVVDLSLRNEGTAPLEWQLQTREDAAAGRDGRVQIRLTTPDGRTLPARAHGDAWDAIVELFHTELAAPCVPLWVPDHFDNGIGRQGRQLLPGMGFRSFVVFDQPGITNVEGIVLDVQLGVAGARAHARVLLDGENHNETLAWTGPSSAIGAEATMQGLVLSNARIDAPVKGDQVADLEASSCEMVRGVTLTVVNTGKQQAVLPALILLDSQGRRYPLQPAPTLIPAGAQIEVRAYAPAILGALGDNPTLLVVSPQRMGDQTTPWARLSFKP